MVYWARIILILSLLVCPLKADFIIDYFAFQAEESEFSPDTSVSSATLVQWFKAEDLTPETSLEEWTDSSGTLNMRQDTSGNRPIAKSSIINGINAVLFDGSNDNMTNATTEADAIFGVIQPVTLSGFKSWIGARSSDAGTYDAIFLGARNASEPLYRRGIVDGSGSTYITGSDGDVGDLVVTSNYVWQANIEISGSTKTARQWINGTELPQGSSTASLLTIDRLVLGAAYHNNSVVDVMNVYIAEILVYDGIPSNADRLAIQTYLLEKYGLPVPAVPIFEGAVLALDDNSGSIGNGMGDLDNDGDEEFVTAASNDSLSPNFKIIEWDGASGFNTYDILTQSEVDGLSDRFGTEVEVADMDGDGLKDVVTVNSSNSGSTGFAVWYKNPNSLGGVWSSNLITTWVGGGTAGNIIRHAELEVGDIDADGVNDVVVRSILGSLYVLMQSGTDGTAWETRVHIAGNPREGLALVDFSGDGKLDILVNGVWFETPSDPVNGTYTQRTILGAEDWYPATASGSDIDDYATKINVGDFNGDSLKDFAISNAEELDGLSASKPLGIRVFLQPADVINDTWTEITIIDTGKSWHSMKSGDLDGDGDLDIISGVSQVGVGSETELVLVFKNDGDGSTFTQEVMSEAFFMYSGHLGDFDGDGDIDMFAPEDWASGPIRYFKNQ